MEKAFCTGLALGMIGGALLVTNSKKARKIVSQGQEKIKKTVEDFKESYDEDEQSEV